MLLCLTSFLPESVLTLVAPDSCTTELGAFANLEPEFTKRNVKLIGLSANTIASHADWIKDINETGGCDLKFPIIGDKTRQIALAYVRGVPDAPRRSEHKVADIESQDMIDQQDATNVDEKGMALTIVSDHT